MTQDRNTHSTLVVNETGLQRRTLERTDALTVEIVRDEAQFATMQRLWNKHVQSSSALVYQTHEWLSLWWKHFRTPDCSLFIIVLRRGSDIVAVAPCYIYAQRFFGFRICRQLKLMGGSVATKELRGLYAEEGPSDYLDIIIAKDNGQEALQSLARCIQDNRHLYDEIDFSNIPERSLLMTVLVPMLETVGYKCHTNRSQPCPYLTTPDSVDGFLQKLPSSVRRKLRHAHKKFSQEPGYSMESVERPRDLLSAFRDLVALHQLRWNGAGYVGLFRDPRYERFIAELASAFQDRGWIWVKAVVMGGARFAVRLGFRFNDRYYDYLSGFDDRMPFAKARPGYALLFSFVEDAIADRSHTIDFLRGAEPYKFDLTSTVAYNWSFRAVNQEYESTVPYRLSQVVFAIENALHRCMREWYILTICFSRYGVVGFLPAYVRFLLGRLKGKIEDVVARWKLSGVPIAEPSVPEEEKSLRDAEEGEKSEEDKTIKSSEQPDHQGLRTVQADNNFYNVRAKILAKIYLSRCTRVGERATTRARPFIENAGSINIGNGFQLDSRAARTALMTGENGSLEIGDDVSIDSGCMIKSYKSVRIGNRVHIGSYVVINDSADKAPAIAVQESSPAPVNIEDDVTIGDRVAIAKGVVIGKGSFVMPGSVVLGNVPSGVIAGGMPARVLARYHVVVPEHVVAVHESSTERESKKGERQ